MDPSKLLVAQLRNELRQRNLDTSGNKATLLARLKSVLSEEQIERERERENENENVIDENGAGSNFVILDTIDLVDESDSHIDMAVDGETDEIEDAVLDGAEVDEGDSHMDMSIVGEPNEIGNAVSNGAEVDSLLNAENPKKVNFMFMTGKRFKSKVIYSVDEKQFYRKNRTLVSGIDSYDCAQKHKNQCKRHIYYDPTKNECVHQMPYVAHDHETHEKTFEDLTVINPSKDNSANPEILSNITGKTSATKKIFMNEVQK